MGIVDYYQGGAKDLEVENGSGQVDVGLNPGKVGPAGCEEDEVGGVLCTVITTAAATAAAAAAALVVVTAAAPARRQINA